MPYGTRALLQLSRTQRDRIRRVIEPATEQLTHPLQLADRTVAMQPRPTICDATLGGRAAWCTAASVS